MSLDIQTLQKLISILTLFAGSDNIGDVVLAVQSLKLAKLEVTGHLQGTQTPGPKLQ